MLTRLRCLVGIVTLSVAAQAQQPAPPEAPAPSSAPAASADDASDDAEAESAAAQAQPGGDGAAGDTTETSREDRQYAAAKQYFDRGVAFFEAENFEAALTEFERAYQHLAGHPKRFLVLDNIGQCHERLFRYDRALEYYHRYLDEGGKDAEDRATVAAVIRSLEGLLATVNIESNVPAEVWVGNRQMGNAPGKVLIPGGRHVIELRARGYESAKKEISIAAREEQTYDFKLDEFYEGISPLYFYGGVVLTAGAVAGGTYFGLKARSLNEEGLRRRDEIGAIANTKEDEDRVKRTAVTADICFASGIVLGVGTTLLYFMTGWDRPEQKSADSKPRVAARLGPNAVGLNVEGSF